MSPAWLQILVACIGALGIATPTLVILFRRVNHAEHEATFLVVKNIHEDVIALRQDGLETRKEVRAVGQRLMDHLNDHKDLQKINL